MKSRPQFVVLSAILAAVSVSCAPSQRVTDSQPPSAFDAAKVSPFEAIGSKQIVVLRRYGGGPFPLFFDAEAGGITVTSGHRDRLALPFKGLVEAASPGGKTHKIEIVTIGAVEEAPTRLPMELGETQIELYKVTFFDMLYASVGLAALQDLRIEIDWQNNRFALSGL